jgi:hypothetical protein
LFPHPLKPGCPGELSPHAEVIQGYRDESVDLLKKLIIQWASRIPSLIEL